MPEEAIGGLAQPADDAHMQVKREPASALPPSTPSTPRGRQVHVAPPTPEPISSRDLGMSMDEMDSAGVSSEAGSRSERKRKATSTRGSTEKTGTLPEAPHPARRAGRQVSHMPALPPLHFDFMDMASGTKTQGCIPTGATRPRHPPARTSPRLFELEEAPTFYPTWEEFQNPLEYIEWTARPDGGNAVAYGLAKIVPPPGWQLGAVVDQHTFRFQTRVQRLNTLSAEGRVAQNYNEQLVQYHVQQGDERVYAPQLAKAPVDLYALKRAVQSSPSPVDWASVTSALGYDVMRYPRAPSVLSAAYKRLVAPFEEYLQRCRSNDSASVARQAAPKPLQDGSAKAPLCVQCQGESPSVTCVVCERYYHLACVHPPLSATPRSDWVCPPCLLQTGADFGFEEGETHSLYSFWQRCQAFERLWADRAALRGEEAWAHRSSLALLDNEDLVEREFWRLVHSAKERVDVEYGADVHSTTHGHASPSMECEPLDVYSRSGWNLNNLPLLGESLLRYIRSDISGMTVPWIYLGMMFSAFCWHNEDHYTYSINYQHWGATKTWYGVPGSDAGKFEAAMRKIAPELFAASPDLLLQLVTMMSPALAKKEGVRMYACNQRPNEFVVTFPKAYHSGFNHGFNLNEAVNFALPDWVMDGLACVQRYQSLARQPVFSHDELLVTIALHSPHLATALWLHPAFRDMVERESAGRARVRALLADAGADAAEESYDTDGEVPCAHCKTLCYLSHVVSATSEGAACLDHATLVHENVASWTLKVRHDDAFLQSHEQRLAERAAIPGQWQQRVKRFLAQHPRPPLRMLRALVQEGEKIPHALPELAPLVAFIERAEPWVAQAQSFLTKRQPKLVQAAKASRRGRRNDLVPSDDAAPAPDHAPRTPEALLALQAQIPALPFEVPEWQALDGVVEQMHAVCRDADGFLALETESKEAVQLVDQAERALSQGELLQVVVPQVSQLRQWIKHVRWFAEVRNLGNAPLSLEEAEELLEEGRACEVPSEHAHMVALAARVDKGRAWSAEALRLLDEAPSMTRDDLDRLLAAPGDMAMPASTRARLVSLQNKAAQWQDTLAEIFEQTQPSSAPPFGDPKALAPREPPHLPEARRVLAEAQAARVEVPHASALQVAVALHDQWNVELHHILHGSSGPAELQEADMDEAKAFCELAIRAASAEAVNAGMQDAPTYAPVTSYPPVPYPPPRSLATPCICLEERTDRAASVTCSSCFTVYHLKCLQRKAKPPRTWRCAFCDDTQLPGWLATRRAVSQLPLVALLQHSAYQRDQFRFVPVNYPRLQAAVRATVEFGVAVSLQFQQGALPASLLQPAGRAPVPAPSARLRHIARRAFACPINVLLIGDATPPVHVPSVLDVCLPVFHIQPTKPAAKKKRRAPSAGAADGAAPSARRRAKRARFTILEEEVLAQAPKDADVYCYCRQADNGTMVQCDRCSHWFHGPCMHIEDPQALQDKWYCPTCCFRQRTKYPWGEVKIRDGTNSHPEAALPDVFVDVTASLKSQTRPVLKRQPWMTTRRILLTLSHFEPAEPAPPVEPAPERAPSDADMARPPEAEAGPAALPAVPTVSAAATTGPAVPAAHNDETGTGAALGKDTSGSSPPWKRARTVADTASPAPLAADEARQRAERMNLLRRGVSEAMMQKFALCWNGESIVCQVAPDRYLLLGPHIVLARDDPDGAHLVRMAMDGLVPWARDVRGPPTWPVTPPPPLTGWRMDAPGAAPLRSGPLASGPPAAPHRALWQPMRDGDAVPPHGRPGVPTPALGPRESVGLAELGRPSPSHAAPGRDTSRPPLAAPGVEHMPIVGPASLPSRPVPTAPMAPMAAPPPMHPVLPESALSATTAAPASRPLPSAPQDAEPRPVMAPMRPWELDSPSAPPP